jgi:hypothetical protein
MLGLMAVRNFFNKYVKNMICAAIGGAALCALFGACTTENAAYCGPGKPCPPGLRCDPSVNRCVAQDGGPAKDGRRRDNGEPEDDAPQPGDARADKPLGAACDGPAECASGFCSDGVCCEAECSGICRSCARPGSAGTCGLVAQGSDADGDCAGQDPACAGTCDGLGACTFAAADKSCQAPSCTTAQLQRGFCDGAGACVQKSESCGGYTCADGTACRTSCVDATTDCTADFECLGGSCSNPQPNGATCGTNPKACQSVQCVDGVCCAAASCPVCQACDVNGQGTCAAAGNGLACGAVTCTAAQKSVPTCQSGTCQLQTQGCNGYQCNDAATDCRAACALHEHCVDTHFCNGSKQCQVKKALGEGCGSAVECASGMCTDGVCCGVAVCGACQRCQAGSGACGAGPDGPAPAGQCPGDAVCGAGVCAAGACAYLPQGTQCAESCSGQTRVVSTCDAAHLCTAGAPQDCTPFRCAADGKTCRTFCVNSGECVSDSVCNRFNAHVDQGGNCIQPAQVVTVTSTSSTVDLQAAVTNALAAGKQHLKLIVSGTMGFTGFSLSSGNVLIFGEAYGPPLSPLRPAIGWPSADKPAISVSGSAAVSLQGVKLTSATKGASCNGGRLEIVDSEIASVGTWGVEASDCDVILRRNAIKGNWGGVKAQSAVSSKWVLATDNLIANNGTYTFGSGTCLISNGGGGLWISSMPVILAGNTITNNVAEKSGPVSSGVHCASLSAGSQITNMIVQNNHCTAAETAGCAFTYSNVPGIASTFGNNPSPCLDANYRAVAPCIDSGEAVPTVSKLDLSGALRPKGAGWDRGAYEVQ